MGALRRRALLDELAVRRMLDWTEVLVDDDAARRFDRALDSAQDQMVLAADRLRLESMSAQAERLALALDRDLIGADDFAS
jgi:hypothetical protein